MSLDPNFAPELTALVSATLQAGASNLDLLLHGDEVEVLIRVNGVPQQYRLLTTEQKRSVLTEIHCKLLGHEKISYDRYEGAVFHLPNEEFESVRVRLAMTPPLERLHDPHEAVARRAKSFKRSSVNSGTSARGTYLMPAVTVAIAINRSPL